MRAAALALTVVMGSLACGAAEAAENRCGWYVNPTPGNFYLSDRDGDWWMRSQGGLEAEGFDNAPEFDPKQYVKLQPNGYGYGCACFSVDTDKAEKNITRIYSGKILPLARCRNDKTLTAPD